MVVWCFVYDGLDDCCLDYSDFVLFPVNKTSISVVVKLCLAITLLTTAGTSNPIDLLLIIVFL